MTSGIARRLRAALKPVGMSLLSTRPSDVREALTRLTPWDVGVPLIRVGGQGDGGYLVPDDNDGIQALFSPGVAGTWSFELQFAEEFGLKSFMLDGSIQQPSGLHPLMAFEQTWLAGSSGPGRISLDDWVQSNAPGPNDDLALQMDIEGAEYEVLGGATDGVLRRFRWVVVEYHGLDLLGYGPRARSSILPVLQKMYGIFDVVHVHANNCCGATMLHGFTIPHVLEVTYLRRDRARSPKRRAFVPHLLDSDCVAGAPPLALPPNWPDSPSSS